MFTVFTVSYLGFSQLEDSDLIPNLVFREGYLAQEECQRELIASIAFLPQTLPPSPALGAPKTQPLVCGHHSAVRRRRVMVPPGSGYCESHLFFLFPPDGDHMWLSQLM